MPLKLQESTELEGIWSWVSEGRQGWGAGRMGSSAGACWLLATALGNRIRAVGAAPLLLRRTAVNALMLHLGSGPIDLSSPNN